MKLFILAAFIAVSYAGRLEHLEQQQMLRAYLPPFQMSFGASPAAHGMPSGPSHPVFNAVASFPSASNQYLPPDHGPSIGSTGFEGDNSAQQFGHQAATPQGAHSFGSQARFQPQSAVTRQYLAPHHSSQDIPQQPFDEQTGYHY